MNRPTGSRWLKSKLVRVHLTNEAPNVGSGSRLVWAARGKKWVYICAANGKRSKMLLSTFTNVFKGDH